MSFSAFGHSPDATAQSQHVAIVPSIRSLNRESKARRKTMLNFMRTAAVLVALLASSAAIAQTDNSLRVRGTVATVTTEAVTVQTGAGETITVKLNANYNVIGYTPIKIEDVPTNAYIASASAPQPDGSLRALSLIVFPESMRGLNEGTKGWDLGPNSRMINATVAQFVPQADGTRELTVKFGKEGQTQKIAITSATQISTFAIAEKSLLAPGAKVVLFSVRGADGSISSGLVGVGKDGKVPPV
jgi:hypothetical protein